MTLQALQRPADHALQRRHADSLVVLRRRLRRRRAALRENPAAIGQAFNIGNPQGTATNFELANLIIRLTNSKSEIVFKPHPGPEVDLRVPSIEKAMTMLGLPADGVARSGRLAGDRVVSRQLRRGDGQEVSRAPEASLSRTSSLKTS